MRANSEKERQQWLVALGSSKASLANRQQRRRISSTTSIKSDTSNLASSMPMTSNVSPDLIKTKKSELRLYCDLLTQQVHSIKSGATENSLSQAEDFKLLGATCDTFISTLDELMNLADANLDIYQHENGVRRVRFPMIFTWMI